jgi:hypothetical protein
MRTALAGGWFTQKLTFGRERSLNPALELLWLVPGAALVKWCTELVAILCTSCRHQDLDKMAPQDGPTVIKNCPPGQWISFQRLAQHLMSAMPEEPLKPHVADLVNALCLCIDEEIADGRNPIWPLHSLFRDPLAPDVPLRKFVSTVLPASSLAHHIPALIRCRATHAFARLPLDAVTPHVPELLLIAC